MNRIAMTAGTLLILFSSMAFTMTENEPQTVIKSTVDYMLETLRDKKTELENKPGLINDLVQANVVPKFDFKRISQSALGRYWGRASEEQQQRFTEEFKALLIRTYTKAVLNYSGEEVEYKPARESNEPDEATVYTLVQDSGGAKIPINYRLHKENGEWRVYDVIIDGVSLVVNYRTQFSNEIRRADIEGLIASLKQRNQMSGMQ